MKDVDGWLVMNDGDGDGGDDDYDDGWMDG